MQVTNSALHARSLTVAVLIFFEIDIAIGIAIVVEIEIVIEILTIDHTDKSNGSSGCPSPKSRSENTNYPVNLIFLFHQPKQILPILIFRHHFSQASQLIIIDITHSPGNFFDTGNCQTLPFLNRLDKISRLQK